MYEELQLIIKAINNGIDQFESSHDHFSYDGSHLIGRLKASLDNPSDAIQLYNETAEQDPDKSHRPYIWDYQVYYRGGLVKLRLLIEKLELLWDEHLMQLEGGS